MLLEKLRDLRIGYKLGDEQFDEKRPTVVMIHGAGGRSQMWQAQLSPLKNSLNTLALDLPGHGETVGQSADRIDEYARWLGETLEVLFREPVFLMGHSMGGAIVIEAAISYPNLLRGIILVSTGPRLEVAPKFLVGFLDKFEETVDSIIGYAYAPGADPILVKEGAKLMKEAGPKTLHDDFLACDRFDRTKSLKKIDLPCLIVCADKDVLAPPPLSKTLQDAIKGSQLKILPSAGHMVMIENYKAFNQCILDFVLAKRT
jgi:pimeloyl-ACP methyl ester carboxylesterase